MLRNEKQYTRAIDVYSFGIMLAEIWNQRVPFNDEDFDSVVGLFHRPRKTHTREHPFLSHPAHTAFAMQIVNGLRPTVGRDCPRELLDLMERCWSDSPKARPSFSNLVPELETLYQNLMASAKPDTVHVQPRPR